MTSTESHDLGELLADARTRIDKTWAVFDEIEATVEKIERLLEAEQGQAQSRNSSQGTHSE